MLESRQVYFEGRVQGVGFRYSVKQIAMGFDVTGWVGNLPDGRVEMLATGSPDELDAFLEAIAESQLAGFIRKQEILTRAPEPGRGRGFQIR
jgi:acylphosphatase